MRVKVKAIATPVVLLVLASVMAGCSEGRRSQCEKLITVANQAVAEVQTIITTNSNPSETAYLNVAETVDRAKTNMSAVELADEQLKGYRQRFVTMYGEVGTSARALSDAVKKQDTQAAATAQKTFEAATQQEEPLVTEVNAYCGAQS